MHCTTGSVTIFLPDKITDWSEFWSRPAVSESLSLATKTPLPPNCAASYLSPHLCFTGSSNAPLRIFVDAKTKRVSVPVVGDDVDKAAGTPKCSRDSPSKRSSSKAGGDSSSPNKFQKVLKVDVQEGAESSTAAALPPTPRPPTPRAVAPAATPRTFPSTVSPNPLSTQQLNSYCGVAVPSGWCLHAVDSCRLHNEKTRRSVLGRGCDFDSILARSAARRSFHDFTMTEMWKSGGMCTVPYPHSTYPPIVGGSRSGSGVEGDDYKSSTSENRVALFGGKKCDDYVLETIGGLKPTYNFKAPFDRYEPPSIRNAMSDLFRVSSDPLFLPLRRPCVPIVKPLPPPAATPQAGGTPGSTPRSSTAKGATGMQGPSTFPAPQSQHPAPSPRASPSLPSSSVANAPPSTSSATTPQAQQQRPSSSKSSKAAASQSSTNTNPASASSTQSSKFVGAAAAAGAAAGATAAPFGKTASAANGSGTPNTIYMSTAATNSTASATAGNTQPQMAKASAFGPSTGAVAQGTPYGASSGASITTTTTSTTATTKTTFNSADGSKGTAAATQSAVATVAGGSASKSTKNNNAAAQAVPGSCIVKRDWALLS